MFVIAHKRIFFGITFALIAFVIAASLAFGFSVSVDFTGGSILEISYRQDIPPKDAVAQALSDAAGIAVSSVRGTDGGGYIIRAPALGSEEHEKAVGVLRELGGGFVEERFSSIGPAIGAELRAKALWAILAVLALIIFFIAYAFRTVSRPVSSWKYGAVAIAALAHDIVLAAGAYAFYGRLTGAEVDTLFVMALLAILGYSVNDTIVVFDRVRENLHVNAAAKTVEPFDGTVGRSLSQSVARSVNTSLTTIFVLLALFFIGSGATQAFVFMLLVGVVAGSYSSLCFAAPLLTVLAPSSVKGAT